MFAGRWLSYAFIKYIRKQVMDFSKRISPRMIKDNLFHTLTDTRNSSFDPKTLNTDSFTTKLSVPMEYESGTRSAT